MVVSATSFHCIAVHGSKPFRCWDAGLMGVEGNRHPYSKNHPYGRETIGFAPQLPVLIVSSAVYSCRV